MVFYRFSPAPRPRSGWNGLVLMAWGCSITAWITRGSGKIRSMGPDSTGGRNVSTENGDGAVICIQHAAAETLSLPLKHHGGKGKAAFPCARQKKEFPVGSCRVLDSPNSVPYLESTQKLAHINIKGDSRMLTMKLAAVIK